ncbi:DUF2953 domain-containing protein [Pasteuria penetrans]|uniref:DUF2953 domain-containing protein n=1 Tax=Pasteuria penetrans TaxID=86005 RepID=UPI000FBEC14D|nr:DUF2953 domain-containing protein [Pasteuria penetrans]
MTITLVIIALILIVLFCIWFSSVRIEADLYKGPKAERGTVSIRAMYGLIRYQIKLDEIGFINKKKGFLWYARIRETFQLDHMKRTKRKEEKSVRIDDKIIRKSIKFLQQLILYLPFVRSLMGAFLGVVRCEHLVWRTEIGTGDAADSGWITALVWMGKTWTIQWLVRNVQFLAPPQLGVQPCFTQKRFVVEIHGIIHFQIGHAILAVKSLFLNRLRDIMRESLYHQRG